MSDTFDKLKALKKWDKEHPGALTRKPNAPTSVIVTKPMIKDIIRNYPNMRNLELAKVVNIEPFQLNMVLSYLRKAGVDLPPKKEQGIKAKIEVIVSELKKEGLII